MERWQCRYLIDSCGLTSSRCPGCNSIRADHKKLVRIHELNAQRSRPADFTAQLRKVGEKSVHNSFHYEVLAFANSINDADLIQVCENRLAEPDRFLEPLPESALLN